jgi:hypothetical protein
MIFNAMIWVGRLMLLAGIVLLAGAFLSSRLPMVIIAIVLAIGGYQLSARGRYLMSGDGPVEGGPEKTP